MSITASVTLANTIENWYNPNDSAPNWSSLAVSSATSTHLTVSSSFNGMAFSLEITGAFSSLGGGATLGNYISSGATVTALSLTTSDGVESYSSSAPISLQLLLQNLSSNSSSGLQQIFSGNDVFVGATSTNSDNSNDNVFGYSGNDTFTGNSTSGPYHDLFDGGDGIDTAVFRGNLANYNIASSFTNKVSDGVTVFSGSTITVTDSVSNRDGAKDLAHVERLQFADANIALDTDGATSAGGIYRLYQATFDRTPDLGGLGYWIKQADNGESGVRMAEDFTWSQEFQQLYGVSTHDNYLTGANITSLVTGFYQHVLHRAPDQGGLNFYVGTITNHEKTVGQVLAEISDSPENYAATIGQIQSGIEYTPSVSTVAENAAGAVIGTLSVTDPDSGNTHTYAVDDTRFEVVSGQLKLKDGISLDHEAAASVNVTVTATEAGGLSKAQAFAISVTDVAETTTLTGTAGNDTVNHAGGLDDFIITGLGGDDSITTSGGNDIIRPGEGADIVNAGAGNDIVVVVGQTAAGQYTQSDIDNPGGSGINLSSVITLADLNGRAVSEVQAGENIDGGTGTNRLVIYGNVDLTGVTLTNITQFQVNSTVTISAQQLNTLGVTVIFGDGESVLNITNSGSDPVTLDLSGITFADFRTLNVGAGVTVVLDQSDADNLHYLTGEGTLKASAATGTLNLSSKYTSLVVQDKDGNADATHGGATFVAGELLIGGEAADTLTGSASDDRIEGGAGNDALTGGDGNDVLRGGAGVDSMDGGAGDDTFVIVGDISGGGKVDSAADTAALGFPLTDLNGQNLNEDEDGAAEIIRGGDGDDTLYVYGTADLTNYDITGIEHIEIRSDVTFTVTQLSSVQSIRGDGGSILRIAQSSTPSQFDINQVSISQINQLDIGQNVTVSANNASSFGGVSYLTGAGSVLGTSTSLDMTGVNIARSLNVSDSVGGLPTGASYFDTVIVASGSATTKTGTAGNDVIPGTANGDILIGLAGADRLIGASGNDVLFGDQQIVPVFTAEASASGGPVVTGENYLVNGLGGDRGFGEGVLGGNDDDSTGAIDITSVFGENGLNFFGRWFTSVYVNNNGNITFSAPTDQFTPSVITAGADNPIIAPFWGDVDTRSGSASATSGGNSTGANLVYYDLDTDAKTFTVTWDDVGYFSAHTDKLNAFQLQLTDKGNGNFDITYRYEDVNWTTGDLSGGSGGLGGSVARAGYSAGTTNGYYEMPQSGNQAQMLALGETGKYVFTVRNGITIDNSNNDTLIGGAGDDIIIGGDGAHDVAVFQGQISEYEISQVGNTLRIADHVLSRDGIDTIFSDVEYLRFSGSSDVSTAQYFTRGSTQISAAELFQNAGTHSIGHPEDISTSSVGGYFKMFFELSAASYYRLGYSGAPEGISPATNPNDDETSALKYDSYRALEKSGVQFLDSTHIGCREGTYTLPTIAGELGGDDYAVTFQQGYYVAEDLTGINKASVALVCRSSDALFIAFRGTDGAGDIQEDLLSMNRHYGRYEPLFESIESYLIANHDAIQHVYVTGHSLGGEMASMFMDQHRGDNMYQAVTFEAANKLLPLSDDLRLINFEMRGDVVPDLGLGNSYGKTIHLDYETDYQSWDPLEAHYMATIQDQFDKVVARLPDPLVSSNSFNLSQRLYVDDNGDGVIVTNKTSALIDVVGRAEDLAEYQVINYNFNTAFDSSAHGTLVIKSIEGLSGGSYNLTESNVFAVLLANDFVSLSENIDVSAVASNHGVVLVGNDGNNVLIGSHYSDVLIGNGDEDVLRGSDGDDYLYGSDYSDVRLSTDLIYQFNLQSKYQLTAQGAQAISVNSHGDFVDDVSYLVGGSGKDVMVGSEDDNDYFLIDCNIRDNENYVDTIRDFFIANTLSDPSCEDYLVFSAQQLGVSIDDIDGLIGATTTVRGQTATYLSSFHFIVVDGIGSYQVNDGANSSPQFVLDKQLGDLYFDTNGSHDVGDQVLLCNVAADSASWTTNLQNFDADQILIMNQSAYNLV